MKVITNNAISLDGKIAAVDRSFSTLGSEEDLRTMEVLRAGVDAIFVGGHTFRCWPYPSTDAPGAPPREKPLINAILTRRGLFGDGAPADPDWASRWVGAPTRPLLFGPEGLDVQAHAAALGGEVFTTLDPNPAWVLAELAAQGVQRVLVEGGGDLLAQLLAQDLVDEVNVTLCPLLLGGVKAPTLLDGPGFSVDDARRLQLIDLRRAGDELFLRYAVIRRKTA